MNRYVDPIHSYRTSAYVHGKTHVIGNTTMRRFIIKQVRYVAWRQKKIVLNNSSSIFTFK